MSVVKCSNCGEETSNQSPFCVHCGRPVSNSNSTIVDTSQKQKGGYKGWWIACCIFTFWGFVALSGPAMRLFGISCLVAAVIGCPLLFNRFKLKKWQRITAIIVVCMIGCVIAPNTTRDVKQVEIKEQAVTKKEVSKAVAKAAEEAAKIEAEVKFIEFVSSDFLKTVNSRNWALNVKDTVLKLRELEYRREKPSIISLSLITENAYISLAHGEPLAKVAVQSCINWVTTQGFDPKNDRISIFVTVLNPYEEKSPTGRDLVQSWGDAKYNYNRDQIEWIAEKK